MTKGFTSGWFAVDDLTEPEASLVAAALAHRWWEPLPVRPAEVTDAPEEADWGAARTVRAQVLYQLLTAQGPPSFAGAEWDIAPRAVRLRGVRVVGQLDLEAATLRCPLALVGCWLDHDAAPVLLREAMAPTIRLHGCWLPAGLDAGQLTTRGDVSLERIRVHGEVRLFGGHVGGHLDLNGGKLHNKGKRVFNGDGLQVDYAAFCGRGFEADGEVSLVGGHVAGDLLLDGGRFRNRGGSALTADRLKVDSAASCGEGFEADGEVRLAGGHVGGALNLTGGKFRNKGGSALNAARLQVDQDMLCGEGFEADGEVRLAGGHVGGQLDLTGGKFRNQGGTALAADVLKVDQNMKCGEGFEADGEVRLLGGHVGRQLELAGRFGRLMPGPDRRAASSAVARNESGTALKADHVGVEGSVHWWPAEVKGRATFAFGSVGVWVDRPAVLDIPVYLHGLRGITDCTQYRRR